MKKPIYLLLLFCIGIVSCRKDPDLEVSDRAVSVTPAPDSITPADFVTGVTNRYFPLVPGRTFRYIRKVANGPDTVLQHVDVQVAHETRIIDSVTCMVVREIAMQDTTKLEEVTSYYAQDLTGTVWKFGEDRKTFTAGVPDLKGSWLAGIDSARAGIKMHANPGAHLGELYYQEYALGIAEDQGLVHDTTRTAIVPFGTFMNCVRIHDTTALDPQATTHQYYAAGIGLVQILNIGSTIITQLEAIDSIPASVSIEHLAFVPDTIAISTGSTVTWTNQENLPHTVTADDESFTSPTLQTGRTFTHTFTVPDTVPYHCSVHPAMKAVVLIR
ncbi:MAG TPA: plastocyanin/azurin family copper-binding protein [Sphingobacteriaceae bacterium]